MTTRYSDKTLGVLDGGGQLGDPSFLGGRVRCLVGAITLASQPADTDGIVLGDLPKGAVPLYGLIETDTSLGSSTVAVGIAGTAAKYKAAATFTATDTPTLFGKAAALGKALSAAERVIATVAAAALPSSGNLRILLFYTAPEGA